jgi:DNA polymerase III sliding clamp (beta) subunit (PCNA family)
MAGLLQARKRPEDEQYPGTELVEDQQYPGTELVPPKVGPELYPGTELVLDDAPAVPAKPAPVISPRKAAIEQVTEGMPDAPGWERAQVAEQILREADPSGQSTGLHSAVQPPDERSGIGEFGARLYGSATVELPEQIGYIGKALSPKDSAAGDWFNRRILEAKAMRENMPEVMPSVDPLEHPIKGGVFGEGASMVVPSIAPNLIPGLRGAAPIIQGAAFGLSEGQRAYEEAIDAGKDPVTARKIAVLRGAIEGGGEGLASLMGSQKWIRTAARPAQKLAVKTITDFARRKGLGDLAKRFVADYLKTVGVEVATEEGQNIGEQLVDFYHGIGKFPTREDVARTALATLGMTTIMAPFGVHGQARRIKTENEVSKLLQNPQADPRARKAAAGLVAGEIRKRNRQAAENFEYNAVQAIANGQPLALDESALQRTVAQAGVDAPVQAPAAERPATPPPVTTVQAPAAVLPKEQRVAQLRAMSEKALAAGQPERAAYLETLAELVEQAKTQDEIQALLNTSAEMMRVIQSPQDYIEARQQLINAASTRFQPPAQDTAKLAVQGVPGADEANKAKLEGMLQPDLPPPAPKQNDTTPSGEDVTKTPPGAASFQQQEQEQGGQDNAVQERSAAEMDVRERPGAGGTLAGQDAEGQAASVPAASGQGPQEVPSASTARPGERIAIEKAKVSPAVGEAEPEKKASELKVGDRIPWKNSPDPNEEVLEIEIVKLGPTTATVRWVGGNDTQRLPRAAVEARMKENAAAPSTQVESPAPKKALPERAKAKVETIAGNITPPSASREPWEMTLAEYARSRVPASQASQITSDTQVESFRLQYIRDMKGWIAAGKPVPAAVIAEYPELERIADGTKRIGDTKLQRTPAPAAAPKESAKPALVPKSKRGAAKPVESKPPELMTPEEFAAGSTNVKIKGKRKRTGLMVGGREENGVMVGGTIHQYANDTETEGDARRRVHSQSISSVFDLIKTDNRTIAEAESRTDAMADTVKAMAKYATARRERGYPVSSAAVDAYGIKLPEGYVREGDRYVFKPKVPTPVSERKKEEPKAVVKPALVPKSKRVKAAESRSPEQKFADDLRKTGVAYLENGARYQVQGMDDDTFGLEYTSPDRTLVKLLGGNYKSHDAAIDDAVEHAFRGTMKAVIPKPVSAAPAIPAGIPTVEEAQKVVDAADAEFNTLRNAWQDADNAAKAYAKENDLLTTKRTGPSWRGGRDVGTVKKSAPKAKVTEYQQMRKLANDLYAKMENHQNETERPAKRALERAQYAKVAADPKAPEVSRIVAQAALLDAGDKRADHLNEFAEAAGRDMARELYPDATDAEVKALAPEIARHASLEAREGKPLTVERLREVARMDQSLQIMAQRRRRIVEAYKAAELSVPETSEPTAAESDDLIADIPRLVKERDAASKAKEREAEKAEKAKAAESAKFDAKARATADKGRAFATAWKPPFRGATHPVEVLGKAAKPKSSLPILGMVAVKDGVGSATDLNATVQAAVPLPDGIYRRLPGSDVLIIENMDIDEMPPVPTIEKPVAVKLADGREFMQALKAAQAAASDDQLRQNLMMVWVSKVNDGALSVAASDAFRLTSTTVPADASAVPDGWTVGLNQSAVIALLADPHSERLTIESSTPTTPEGASQAERMETRGVVRFSNGNTTVTARLPDVARPDFAPLLAQATAETLTVDRKAFNKALATLKKMAGKVRDGVVVAITRDGGTLTLTVKDARGKTFSESVPVEVSAGRQAQGMVSVAMPKESDFPGDSFSMPFLSDAAKVGTSAKVSFGMVQGIGKTDAAKASRAAMFEASVEELPKAPDTTPAETKAWEPDTLKAKPAKADDMLRAGAPKGSILPILYRMHAKGGVGRTTDLENEVEAPTSQPDGLWESRGNAWVEAEEKANEFPEAMKIVKPVATFTMKIDQVQAFKSGLLAVQPAEGTYEARPVLTGVLLDIAADGSVSIVATDGRRLHIATAGTIKGVKGDGVRMILRPQAVKLLLQSNGAGPVTVKLGAVETEYVDDKGNKQKSKVEAAEITDGNITLRTKMIDGTYPNFRQVIPKPEDQKVKLRVNRKALGQAIADVRPYIGGDPELENANSLRLDISDKEIVVKTSGNRPQYTMERTVPVTQKVAFEGDAMAVAFNPDFLLDMVRAGNSETVDLSLTDEFSPMTVTNEDGTQKGLLMPFRLTARGEGESTAIPPLVAIHNLSERNLSFAEEMGGIAMPSLGIANAEKPYTGFGEITMIGSPDLVDPQLDRTMTVVDADQYSPRYPSAVHMFSKGVEKVWKPIEQWVKDTYGDMHSETLKKEDYDIRSALYGLHSHNEAANRFNDDGVDGMMRDKALMAYYAGTKLGRVFKNTDDVDGRSALEDFIGKEHKAEFESWVRETFSPFVERNIFKGFSYDGSRKRYAPYTLDYVMKELRKAIRSKEGEGFFYGAGNVRAAIGSKRYRTLDQVKADRGRIQEAIDEEKKGANERMIEIANSATGAYEHSVDMGFAETFWNAVVDAVRSRNPRAKLKEYGFDYGMMPWSEIRSFLADLKAMPSEYFEAKPQRVVQLQEFIGAVIPNTASEQTRTILKRHGIRVREYDPAFETDRKRVVNEFSQQLNAQFAGGPSGELAFLTPLTRETFDATLSDATRTVPFAAENVTAGLSTDQDADTAFWRMLEESGEGQAAVDVSNLARTTVDEQGVTFATGRPVTFAFIRNKESATDIYGKPKKSDNFDRGYEPSGRFMSAGTDDYLVRLDPKKYEAGTVTFSNPLVLEGGEYGTETSWKRSLSKAFGGKRGKVLSIAIRNAGYDGIVTVQTGSNGSRYTSEILDLTTFDPAIARYHRSRNGVIRAITYGNRSHFFLDRYDNASQLRDDIMEEAGHRLVNELGAKAFAGPLGIGRHTYRGKWNDVAAEIERNYGYKRGTAEFNHELIAKAFRDGKHDVGLLQRFMDAVIRAFRQMARRMDFNVTLSDSDVRSELRRMLEAKARAENPVMTVQRAVAMARQPQEPSPVFPIDREPGIYPVDRVAANEELRDLSDLGDTDVIQVVENQADLPAPILEAAESEIQRSGLTQIEGVHYRDKIYIVLENIRDRAHFRAKVLHEMFHRGLRRVLTDPDSLNQVLNSTLGTLGRKMELASIARKRGLNLAKAADFRVAVEELLAKISEERKSKPNVFKRLVAAIRQQLRARGYVKALSDNDIDWLIERALTARRPGEKRGRAQFSLERPLPEMKTRDVVVSKQGREYIVHRVRTPKRDTGYDEPLYRMERAGIVGHKEWTVDELNDAGLEFKEEPKAEVGRKETQFRKGVQDANARYNNRSRGTAEWQAGLVRYEEGLRRKLEADFFGELLHENQVAGAENPQMSLAPGEKAPMNLSSRAVTKADIAAAEQREDIGDLLLEWWDDTQREVSDDLRSYGSRSQDYEDPPNSMDDLSTAKQREFVLWLRENEGASKEGTQFSLGKAPAFYSALERAVKSLPDNFKAPGDQFRARLEGARNKGQPWKQQEAEETGLLDFLKMRQEQGQPVTKADVVAFVEQNGVRIETVRKGRKEAVSGLWFIENATVEPYTGQKADGTESIIVKADTEESALSIANRYDNSDGRDREDEDGNDVAFPTNEDLPDGVESDDTKFASYAPPGGVPGSYREVLLTVPGGLDTGESQQDLAEQRSRMMRDFRTRYGDAFIDKLSPVEKLEYDRIKARQKKVEASYTSPHWSEPNVIAHMLMDERRIPLDVLAKTHPDLSAKLKAEGKTEARALHMIEGQSDLHQTGAVKGYDKLTSLQRDRMEQLQHEGEQQRLLSDAEDAELKKLESLAGPYMIERGDMGVPNLPFRGDAWKRLVIRKMLAEAADGGYDLLTWSTGEDRFKKWGSQRVDWKKTIGGKAVVKDLSEPVLPNRWGVFADGKRYGLVRGTREKAESDAAHFEKNNPPGGDAWTVSAQEQSGGEHEGQNIEALARERGVLLEQKGQTVRTKADLRHVIEGIKRGDETNVDKLTDRIWDRMQAEPEGTSLPRKEFFEFLYDTSFRNEASAILKKMDKAAGVGKTSINTGDDRQRQQIERGVVPSEYSDRLQSPVHAIALTPAIRAAVAQGQPMFSLDRRRGMGDSEGMTPSTQTPRPEGTVTPEQDAAYLDAVKRGDLATAQRMVDEAARKAGYNVGPVWHGTPAHGFTVFDVDQPSQNAGPDTGIGMMFTSRRSSADYFARRTARGEGPGSGRSISSRLKLRNPMEFDGQQEWLDYVDKFGGPNDVRDDLRRNGHDGAVIWNADVARGVDRDATEHWRVVFDPSQIKSADPVTRDDAGHVIPLSERFNPATPDIRFSMALSNAVRDGKLDAGVIPAAKDVAARARAKGIDLDFEFVDKVQIERLDNPLVREQLLSEGYTDESIRQAIRAGASFRVRGKYDRGVRPGGYPGARPDSVVPGDDSGRMEGDGGQHGEEPQGNRWRMILFRGADAETVYHEFVHIADKASGRPATEQRATAIGRQLTAGEDVQFSLSESMPEEDIGRMADMVERARLEKDRAAGTGYAVGKEEAKTTFRERYEAMKARAKERLEQAVLGARIGERAKGRKEGIKTGVALGVETGKQLGQTISIEDSVKISLHELAQERKQRYSDALFHAEGVLEGLEARMSGLGGPNLPTLSQSQMEAYKRSALAMLFGEERYMAMRRASKGDLDKTLQSVRDAMQGELAKHYVKAVERLMQTVKPSRMLPEYRDAWKAAVEGLGPDSYPKSRWKDAKAKYQELAGIYAENRQEQNWNKAVDRGTAKDRGTAAAMELVNAVPEIGGLERQSPRRRGLAKTYLLDKWGNFQTRALALGGGEAGSVTEKTLFRDISDGEKKKLQTIRDSIVKLNEVIDRHAITRGQLIDMRSELKPVTVGGETIQMTDAERIDLAAAMHDPENRDMISINGWELKRRKGQLQARIIGETPEDTMALVKQALNTMTPAQKEIADKMVDVVTAMGVAGNKVSVARDGWERFTKSVYWPREVDRSTTQQTLGKDDSNPSSWASLHNKKTLNALGFTKERQEHTHPLMVGDAFDKFYYHVNMMAGYSHLNIPTYNAMRLLGHPIYHSELVRRMGIDFIQDQRKMIERASGLSGYLAEGGLRRWFDTLSRNAAVTILWYRPTSIIFNRYGGAILAGSEIYRLAPKQLARFTARTAMPISIHTRHAKNVISKLMQNGYFWQRWDHDMSRVYAPLAHERYGNVERTKFKMRWRRMQEYGLRPMAKAEMRTAIAAYEALRRDGLSEAEAVNATEAIIRATQNPSSALDEAPAYMTLRDSGLGGLFPFLGQPMAARNLIVRNHLMLKGAIRSGNRQKVRQARKALAMSVAALAGNLVLEIAVRSALRALSRTKPPDDEDKDRELMYKLMQLTQNILDFLVPTSGRVFDYLREAASFRGARDISLMGAAVTKAFRGFFRVVNPYDRDDEFDADKLERGILDLIDGAGMLLGAPTGGPLVYYRLARGVFGDKDEGSSGKPMTRELWEKRQERLRRSRNLTK